MEKYEKVEVRKPRVKKLDRSNIYDAVNLFIETHPFCSLKDIQTVIFTTFKISVSSELIRLFLERNNFTKKRVRYYSNPSNDEVKLSEFLEKREQFVKENRNFISIYETSFGRNYLPAIGYSKKDKEFT
jgi:hypothetical protein